MSSIALLGSAKRQVGLVKNIDRNDSSSEGNEIELIDFGVGLETANVVTSLDASGYGHYPVLDLDLPARLLPSSTPGHGHLYIDRLLRWEQYAVLLDALGEAGILQPGYVSASKKRGHTAVRLPWVSKPAAIPF